ncbi:CHAP domain-containing protein [Sedimentibacter sp. zth1]|uniref:CHAP domain-containing protein n=1 Tax=Sedimentibacter sp. zth1 TaxID=2816908 RepID=UPI001A90D487|nr:CHAP domain-containing protein [Sedimentibacter sp. zth1]QSX06998.1 CHAP domain-containing protein [Sedimentibacter sp. zth1]
MNSSLANIAKKEAQKFYHGNVMGTKTNLQPIADLFPYSDTWTIDSWDNCWCAAFVYHCVKLSGYELPIRYQNKSVNCSFAGVIAWEQWAKLLEIHAWIEKTQSPQVGDIVLFDNVFENKAHDHIGIVLNITETMIETAEGNFGNVSAIVKRSYENVRGYVRL